MTVIICEVCVDGSSLRLLYRHRQYEGTEDLPKEYFSRETIFLKHPAIDYIQPIPFIICYQKSYRRGPCCRCYGLEGIGIGGVGMDRTERRGSILKKTLILIFLDPIGRMGYEA